MPSAGTRLGCRTGRAAAGRLQRGRDDAMRTDNAERTDWPPPDLLGRGMLRRAAGRWWWAPLVGGVVWFLIAWLVLRADAGSLATVGALVGAAFLLAAVNEAAVAGFATGGWRVAHYVLGRSTSWARCGRSLARSTRSSRWPRSWG